MTRTGNEAAVALTQEIAEVFAAHGATLCRPSVVEDNGQWTLQVTFVAQTTEAALEILELATALRRVQDVAQIRGFAETYGIEPWKLEALLPDAARAGLKELRTQHSAAGDDRVREIVAEIAETFRCFGDGVIDAASDPVMAAAAAQQPFFAAGVDIAQVVRFVLERLEAGNGAARVPSAGRLGAGRAPRWCPYAKRKLLGDLERAAEHNASLMETVRRLRARLAERLTAAGTRPDWKAPPVATHDVGQKNGDGL